MRNILSWKPIRKFFNDVHLWMGIGAGIILFIVCLTGTIYTFQPEIVEWVDRDKYYVDAGQLSPLSIEDLSFRVGEQVEGNVATVRIFPNDEKAYQFTVRSESNPRGTTILVNQYTGEVLGDTQSTTSDFFFVMFRMHRWLMMDMSIGRPIVGWATFIFVFIILTGLVIWFPQKVKSWKQGLKIKWDANWKRINHDLHNSLGLYTAVFLLIMGITGLHWSFTWFNDGIKVVLGVNEVVQTSRQEPPAIEPESVMLSAEEILAIVDAELPFEGIYQFNLPNPEQSTVSVRKYHTGFFASASPDDITLNAYTGAMLSKYLFSERPLNEQIASSLKAIHIGSIFGTFSKIIYFISCLIATSLPVTGTIIWINKLRKKAKRRKNGKRKLALS